MNDAIRIAIEKGGYQPFRTFKMSETMDWKFLGKDFSVFVPRLDFYAYKNIDEIILDYEFWISLGRALNWPDENRFGNESIWNWRHQALKYFDEHLMGNGDIFWEEILKNKY